MFCNLFTVLAKCYIVIVQQINIFVLFLLFCNIFTVLAKCYIVIVQQINILVLFLLFCNIFTVLAKCYIVIVQQINILVLFLLFCNMFTVLAKCYIVIVQQINILVLSCIIYSRRHFVSTTSRKYWNGIHVQMRMTGGTMRRGRLAARPRRYMPLYQRDNRPGNAMFITVNPNSTLATVIVSNLFE